MQPSIRARRPRGGHLRRVAVRGAPRPRDGVRRGGDEGPSPGGALRSGSRALQRRALHSDAAALHPGRVLPPALPLPGPDDTSGAVLEPIVTGRVFPDRSACAVVHGATKLAPLAARMRDRPEVAAFAAPAAVIDELSMVVHVWPVDGELPTLVDATDRRRMIDVFRETLPESLEQRVRRRGLPDRARELPPPPALRPPLHARGQDDGQRRGPALDRLRQGQRRWRRDAEQPDARRAARSDRSSPPLIWVHPPALPRRAAGSSALAAGSPPGRGADRARARGAAARAAGARRSSRWRRWSRRAATWPPCCTARASRSAALARSTTSSPACSARSRWSASSLPSFGDRAQSWLERIAALRRRSEPLAAAPRPRRLQARAAALRRRAQRPRRLRRDLPGRAGARPGQVPGPPANRGREDPGACVGVVPARRRARRAVPRRLRQRRRPGEGRAAAALSHVALRGHRAIAPGAAQPAGPRPAQDGDDERAPREADLGDG